MSDSVEITEQADADLRGIFEYIAFELKSIQNAAGQLARLEKNIPEPDAGAFSSIWKRAMAQPRLAYHAGGSLLCVLYS